MLTSLLILLLPFFSHAQNPDVVKIGYVTTPPLIYTSHDKKLTGITYDLVRTLLREADIYHVTYLAFSDKKSATEALKTGDIHIFLGNVDDNSHPNIVATAPYMIDGVYSIPLPQSFTERLKHALNWLDLALSTLLFFTVTASLCAFFLVVFDTHHQKNLRFKPLSTVFFSKFYTLFSSFSRSLISAPLSTAGRFITAIWTALTVLWVIFLTTVMTCALISALSPPPPKSPSLAEISGQRVGLLDDGYGTAYALSNTSILHLFTDTHDLLNALENGTIDYAVVSGAFFTHSYTGTPHSRMTALANMPLTLNPQSIALNKDFARTILFDEAKVTYSDYFNVAIHRALHSLSLYHLCTRYVKTPYSCVF